MKSENKFVAYDIIFIVLNKNIYWESEHTRYFLWEDFIMLFICYEKCTTCQKAKKWLSENNFTYELRDIKKDNPSKEELINWHEKSKLPLKKFFNTSGLKYKELGLAKKLSELTADEQYTLLASDGMLVKRPLLITEQVVLLGFKESEWQEKLQ